MREVEKGLKQLKRNIVGSNSRIQNSQSRWVKKERATLSRSSQIMVVVAMTFLFHFHRLQK